MKQRSAKPRLPFAGRTRLDPDHVERYLPPLPGTKAAEAPQPVTAPIEQEMGEGVVAPGRSIDVPVGDQKMIAGFSVAEARDVTRLRCVRYMPGEKVRLPLSEISRLRKLGALVDPDTQAPPRLASSSTTSPY
jgi:hypothetical protein